MDDNISVGDVYLYEGDRMSGGHFDCNYSYNDLFDFASIIRNIKKNEKYPFTKCNLTDDLFGSQISFCERVF